MKPRRPAVWEPRGETVPEVMPEWEVFDPVAGHALDYVLAHHAFDAWKQVHGAPAFGSCRVRRVVE